MKSWSKMIRVNYEIKRGDETELRSFTLPVSKERHAELASGLQPNNKVWEEVKDALKLLVRVQDADAELGGWGIELKVKMEDD